MLTLTGLQCSEKLVCGILIVCLHFFGGTYTHNTHSVSQSKLICIKFIARKTGHL